MKRTQIAALLVFVLVGCEGVPSSERSTEPIRVLGAQFRPGELPTGEATSEVTAIELSNSIIASNQGGRTLRGRISPDGYAIGLRFLGLGSGYWVQPVQGPDPTVNNELVWDLAVEFGRDIPAGMQTLSFVAFDANGVAGPIRELKVCVLPPWPDNLNACDPTIRPPDRIVELEWSSDVDLDLLVRTPSGKVVSAKNPSTLTKGEGLPGETDPTTEGVFQRDSNAECQIDSIRREFVVWQTAPSAGSYPVFVNLFESCGKPQAHFTLRVLRSVENEDGTFGMEVEEVREGQLIALQANGGANIGTFITNLRF
jgi:hypothetical protein